MLVFHPSFLPPKYKSKKRKAWEQGTIPLSSFLPPKYGRGRPGNEALFLCLSLVDSLSGIEVEAANSPTSSTSGPTTPLLR